jgi:phage gpG-like protein
MSESFTSYSVDNDRSFRNALSDASKEISDFRIPFALILADFYKSQQAIFKLSGPGQYPDFKNGGANSKYAIAKQKAVGFKYPLLVRSGKLAASLLGPNNPGSVAVITSLSLSIGSNISYGIYHQSDNPRKKIPLRKFLFIGPEAKRFATSDQVGRLQRWTSIINDHVKNKAKAAL